MALWQYAEGTIVMAQEWLELLGNQHGIHCIVLSYTLDTVSEHTYEYTQEKGNRSKVKYSRRCNRYICTKKTISNSGRAKQEKEILFRKRSYI